MARTWTTARLPEQEIVSLRLVYQIGGLEHTASFKDLTRSLGAVGQGQRDNLVESRELDIIQNDEGTVDAANGVVADARLDVHHPRVDGEILSGHVCGVVGG
jgi:hypothetical protein